MFAGHVGVALALGRVERRVNVGVFVAASLLLDLLLWAFILLGWETVTIPADFEATHQPEFVFPYSHGLAGAALWSVLAGTSALLAFAHPDRQRWRAATLVALAVFSHWLLDALVHRPELPLGGGGSPAVGAGLWNNMPAALLVEAAIVALGVCVFLPGCGLTRGRSLALAVLSLVTLGFTVAGMTVAPPPPSATAMAGSSLVTIAVICALTGWLARCPREDITFGGTQAY